MNSLKEITQVIARLKLEKIEIIDEEPTLGDQDNISKLYFGIKSNSLTTDQQAAQLIYGSSLVDTRFTTLKNRLKNRLLNTLFFLDIKPPQQSELSEATYKTYKYLFWSKTLIFLGARKSGSKLALKAVNWSVKYCLTAEAVQLLTELRYGASLSGSSTEYNQYNSELKTQVYNLMCELEVREYHDRLTMQLAKANADNQELIQLANAFIEKLDSLNPKPSSFYYLLYYLYVKNYAMQLKGDYRGSIFACNEAEELLKTYPHLSSKMRLGEFAINKLSCYLQLKEFSEGTNEALKCKELFSTNSNAWFVFMEYYFLLAMHTAHFTEARIVYDEVVTNPRFSFQLEQTKEKWTLFEAYLLFVLSITQIGTISKQVSSFDFKRFLKDVPTYKKDKRGYNVSILVLQILVLLEQNNFDAIIDRMDALRTYRQRYLSSSTHKQIALFFKMLMVMEKSFFTYEETKTKAQKYYDQMLELGSNSDDTQEGLQILPFEWLWNRILDMLKEKERLGIIR